MGGRGQTCRDRLGILVPGLAKVDVEVDEPGQDHDAAIVDTGALVVVEPRHRLEDPVGHDELTRPFAPRGRVDEPRPRDLEIGDDLTDRRALRDGHARVPASR